MIKKINEKEVKILNINKEEIVRKLLKLGAKKYYNGVSTIKLFDIEKLNSDKIDIPNIRNELLELTQKAIELSQDGSQTLFSKGIYFRIRLEGNNNEATIKIKNSGDSIYKEEIELNVEINEDEKIIFEKYLINIGFKIVADQEKERIGFKYSYMGQSIKFDIDTWPGIPTYIEIEGNDDESISHGINLLNLEDFEKSNLSGQALFDIYDKEFYTILKFNE